MDEYEELDRRVRKASSLEDSILVLSELLEGGYSVWEDGSLYNIKQLVAKVRGLQIHIYANEHAPPHFHVKGAEIDACFTISDCEFIRGQIGGREKKLVEWWFERSKPLLESVWDLTRPSDCNVGPVTH